MAADVDSLGVEEIIEKLMAQLSECNQLVSILGQKANFDREDLRKLRNDLMFARSKARNLARAYKKLQRPVDSFRRASSSDP